MKGKKKRISKVFITMIVATILIPTIAYAAESCPFWSKYYNKVSGHEFQEQFYDARYRLIDSGKEPFEVYLGNGVYDTLYRKYEKYEGKEIKGCACGKQTIRTWTTKIYIKEEF
ncbi:hypothetical protein SAMN02745248_01146 [Hathewaya proteolytica DSM 3090]|uniref:Uncharacterized protein n=1 Tax=Hathewaya proteolytica DSM 3090 TaxID=1121331 RepID=A0A1M6MSD7_9CLOT|nr:hypothetical protein [Hathewaya proteolytica]SHJ86377.1 hypothetical protein SAMN02745248_01146 [Hathewaya proteolytica DSM 3090]